ncbi:MAG: cobalamin biosynthesis protein CbiD [Synergistaceae bacterium]|nr:cobalamin biosynthesis protein CbiD [Synergistaceae bacterium]
MALREGYTTGTCAAAAAKAAAIFLAENICVNQVKVTGPTGREFLIDVFKIDNNKFGAIKDAGDDVDITDGMTICTSLEILDDNNLNKIIFEAGEGVGVITLPGMKLPVGEAAINPGPRIMIENALREVLGDKGVKVIISIPGGEEKAQHTFNPRLGVKGGLSVLGTTGVVKPMDEAALIASLDLELSVIKSLEVEDLIITFGNTGELAVRKAFNIAEEDRVIIQAGNYIGHVLDEAARLGFKRCLVAGHPGKLLKVTAGSFYTHNRAADGRLEALCTHAALNGVETKIIKDLYNCRTTENAIEIIDNLKLNYLWQILAEVTARRCENRNFGELICDAAFVNNNAEILGGTKGVKDFNRL